MIISGWLLMCFKVWPNDRCSNNQTVQNDRKVDKKSDFSSGRFSSVCSRRHARCIVGLKFYVTSGTRTCLVHTQLPSCCAVMVRRSLSAMLLFLQSPASLLIINKTRPTEIVLALTEGFSRLAEAFVRQASSRCSLFTVRRPSAKRLGQQNRNLVTKSLSPSICKRVYGLKTKS